MVAERLVLCLDSDILPHTPSLAALQCFTIVKFCNSDSNIEFCEVFDKCNAHLALFCLCLLLGATKAVGFLMGATKAVEDKSSMWRMSLSRMPGEGTVFRGVFHAVTFLRPDIPTGVVLVPFCWCVGPRRGYLQRNDTRGLVSGSAQERNLVLIQRSFGILHLCSHAASMLGRGVVDRFRACSFLV